MTKFLHQARSQSRRAMLQSLGGAVGLAFAGLPLAAAAAGPNARKLKIGVIGAGRIGGTVGGLWVKAGHHVLFSSRHPDRLKGLVRELGSRARAGRPREAASFGEVVLVSVPYHAVPQIGRDFAAQLKGKIVLETGNPFPGRDGAMAGPARAMGVGLASARFLPGTRLVRAFNSVGYFALRSEAHRAGERVAIPLAGDDKQALEVASRLVRDAGFEPVIVGPLASAKKFDVGTAVFGRALTAAELKQRLGL
jgi:predicted dinucleotide-binding enzyme